MAMNIYYEIVTPGTMFGEPIETRYYTHTINSQRGEAMHTGLFDNSSRVWVEEDGHVRFIRNDPARPFIHQPEVDLKEFMWIKLSAKNLPV
jgi:hypothetical protein